MKTIALLFFVFASLSIGVAVRHWSPNVTPQMFGASWMAAVKIMAFFGGVFACYLLLIAAGWWIADSITD